MVKYDGKRPLGRLRRVWECNIKTYLQEVRCRGVDWIDVAEEKVQVAIACACGNEPPVSIKCGEFLD